MYYFENERFEEVNVEITNICNFDCWFCPRGAFTRKTGMMTYEKFKEMILKLKTLRSIKMITLAGVGEPTLHPDLVKMIRFAKENAPFEIVLTTNASKFADTSFVADLFKSGLDQTTISLRITDDSEFNPASSLTYDNYIHAILNFVETKYKLNSRMLIELALFKETYYSKYVLDIAAKKFINTDRLNDLFKKLSLASNKALPSYSDLTKGVVVRLTNMARVPAGDGMVFRFDGLGTWTTALEKYKNKNACHESRYGSCFGLLTQFAIYWNGEVSSCCLDFNAQNVFGNIFDRKDIIEILSSDEAVAFAKELRNRKMPSKTCRICRGGSTFKEKLANMSASLFCVE